MRRFLFTFTVMIAGCCAMNAGVIPVHISSDDIAKALDALDARLERRALYVEAREQSIDSLKTLFGQPGCDTLALRHAIAKQYQSFNVDSTLMQIEMGYHQALRTGNEYYKTLFMLMSASVMPSVGLVREAVDLFDRVLEDSVPPGIWPSFHEYGHKMYSSISDYYSDRPDIAETYDIKVREYRQDAMRYMVPGSLFWQMCEAENYFAIGNYRAAIAEAVDLLEQLPDNCDEYAHAAMLVSRGYNRCNNRDEELYFMILAAMSEIGSASCEGSALLELGRELYERGDADHAHRYLSVAVENMAVGSSSLRMPELKDSLLLIQKSYQEREHHRTITMWIIVVVVIVWLAVVVWALSFYRREASRLKKANERINSLVSARGVYVSHFLELCALSNQRLASLLKLVNRKLSTGQVQDLYAITKSGRIMDEQRRDFFQIFDRHLVVMYPRFVDELNSLLRPEERYAPIADNKFPTELRVYAFMWLGIDDVSEIADFMGYSVNTIYAYRAKVKAKAIDRDTFDADFMRVVSRG